MLTDRDEMCNLYRGPSIDASYHVSVHLAKQFQRIRIFRHRSIRNKNCLWQPRLLTDQDKMSILYREPSIDTFNQVWLQLAQWFLRRRLKFTTYDGWTDDDGRQVMAKAHVAFGQVS